MTAHECEEYIEEPPQRKRYAFRKPERQRDFLRLKLTLPSERRTGKPPPDPLLVLCRLQIHRGSRCSTVTKIPDTTDMLWEYDGLHTASQLEGEEVMLELQRMFYEDIRMNQTHRGISDLLEKKLFFVFQLNCVFPVLQQPCSLVCLNCCKFY